MKLELLTTMKKINIGNIKKKKKKIKGTRAVGGMQGSSHRPKNIFEK